MSKYNFIVKRELNQVADYLSQIALASQLSGGLSELASAMPSVTATAPAPLQHVLKEDNFMYIESTPIVP